MILGIGTDIAGIQRMREVVQRYGDKLAQRMLAPEELPEYAQARDPATFLTKRFAAKEAFAKAVGTGMRAPVLLTSIRVVHDALGRPSFDYAPELARWLRLRGMGRAQLSLSDERDYVVAFVLIESLES